MTDWQVIQGDCVPVMAAMPEASVDAVVCDPPYGLGFMGKEWDSAFEAADMPMRRNGAQDAVNAGASRQGGRQRAGADYQKRMARDSRAFQAWSEQWAREALRVLKPGGHLLAFGGTRTYHRLAAGIEDAGFEIRDCIAWLYGSGFPKSLDVSKAITNYALTSRDGLRRDAPATADAVRWQGWGTALKPAHEPVVVARKPLAGTVAGNVLAHGTGALNVDGCRIAGEPDSPGSTPATLTNDGTQTYGKRTRSEYVVPAGRWPANVVLDPDAAAMLDAQTGELGRAGGRPQRRNVGDDGRIAYGDGWHGTDAGGVAGQLDDDVRNASRFFYCAKASSAERNAGLDGFEPVATIRYSEQGQGPAPQQTPRKPVEQRNVHPTVKPIDLMRWLVRLVTPPGGLVLDPFNGSGTTGCAAVLDGFQFVGIEHEPEYAAIARARIQWWAKHPDGMQLVERLEHERARKAIADAGQLDIFGGTA